MNNNTIPVGYFDGDRVEGRLPIAFRVADRPDGWAGVATISIPGTDLQDVGYGIAWAADDYGRVCYAVTDGSAWPVFAATVEEAWALAVKWASQMDSDCPVDIAYDLSIPARAYGNKADLLAGIPTN